MRLVKQFFILSALSISVLAVSAVSASAKSSSVKGSVKSVKASKQQLTLKSGKKSIRVRLSSKTLLSGGDRSGDGALDLADIRKGDRVTVRGSRKGGSLLASNLQNLSSLPEGDDDGDGISDDLSLEEVRGRITAFNPEQRLVSLEVSDADSEQLLDTQLEVSLPEGAILVVGDRNRDKRRDWADVAVGDRVMALLLSPVDLESGAEAMLMIDRDSLSGKKGKPRNPARTPMGGLVTEVNAVDGLVTFAPPRLDLEPVTVRVTPQTELELEDTNQDGLSDLRDILPGQKLHALVDASDPEDLVALKLEVESDDDFSDDDGGDQGDDSPERPDAPPALNQQFEVKGAFVSPLPNAFLFQVREGPGAGSTVRIDINASTKFEGRDLNGDGKLDLLDCPPGAPAELKLLKTELGALALKVELKRLAPSDRPEDDSSDSPQDD